MDQRPLQMQALLTRQQQHAGQTADQRADHPVHPDPDAAAIILLHAEHCRDAGIKDRALSLTRHVQQQT